MSSKTARRRRLKPSVRRKRREIIALASRDPDNRRALAIHESGHAVAAAVLGLGLESVSVAAMTMPDGFESAGRATIEPLDLGDIAARGAAAAIPRMAAILAGLVAEEMYHRSRGERSPFVPDLAPYPDRDQLWEIAKAATCDPELDAERTLEAIEDLYREANRRATDLIHRHIDSILATATALLRQRTLTGEEVAAIVAAKSPDSS